jgi:hypothetical protein
MFFTWRLIYFWRLLHISIQPESRWLQSPCEDALTFKFITFVAIKASQSRCVRVQKDYEHVRLRSRQMRKLMISSKSVFYLLFSKFSSKMCPNKIKILLDFLNIARGKAKKTWKYIFYKIARRSAMNWENKLCQNSTLIYVTRRWICHQCQSCSPRGSRYMTSQTPAKTFESPYIKR